MKNPSVEKLREDSVKHLLYEIEMMQETAKRLQGRELHKDRVLKNAVVESCLIHARVLTGFIDPEYQDGKTKKKVRDDDVTSYNYVSDKTAWMNARGATPPPVLKNVLRRTAKEIAHLTTKRLAADDPEKPWPLDDILRELHDLLKKFAAHAPDRLHPDVVQYIADLRPPVKAAQTIFYDDSGAANQMTTTDVRTIGPSR